MRQMSNSGLYNRFFQTQLEKSKDWARKNDHRLIHKWWCIKNTSVNHRFTFQIGQIRIGELLVAAVVSVRVRDHLARLIFRSGFGRSWSRPGRLDDKRAPNRHQTLHVSLTRCKDFVLWDSQTQRKIIYEWFFFRSQQYFLLSDFKKIDNNQKSECESA